jgi:hypothetical protein
MLTLPTLWPSTKGVANHSIASCQKFTDFRLHSQRLSAKNLGHRLRVVYMRKFPVVLAGAGLPFLVKRG